MKRRIFLKISAQALMVAPVAGITVAQASDLPHLSEDDPAAQGLGYKHDAGDVDKSKYPRYEEGQNCANCNLIQGEEGAEWRACPIFAGKAVNAKGWCNAWVGTVG